ncbi:hypothetical protein [Dactylosporangium sp. CA-233914]|uniref:hypothetical protein n=1 Tax=Dactylosporangium sp. CA-233914 TaxID=3239934 RepID=UPI003D8C6ECC
MLTHGRHRRELDGSEPGASADRMTLTAVVNGVEALTRPAAVEVRVASGYVRRGVGGNRSGDGELWQRLDAAVRRHDISWDWGTENGAEALTAGAALARFLDEQRASGSFGRTEEVVAILRYSIAQDSDTPVDELPAASLPDKFGMFFNTMVHKQFASPGELQHARTVLAALVGWLEVQGVIAAGAGADVLEDVASRVEGSSAVRRFVDELSEHLENDPDGPDPAEIDGVDPEDLIEDEYLTIDEVGDGSITFDGRRVGVPARIAALAQPGWSILLSAARIDGTWHLLDVVNGDPS